MPNARAFQRVFEDAKRSRDRYFTVLSRTNQKKLARLGLAISRKNCRAAVQRNRLKRLIRESFRRYQADLTGLDIVVMNQSGASAASNSELFDSLAAHWQRCRKGSGTAERGGRAPDG